MILLMPDFFVLGSVCCRAYRRTGNGGGDGKVSEICADCRNYPLEPAKPHKKAIFWQGMMSDTISCALSIVNVYIEK